MLRHSLFLRLRAVRSFSLGEVGLMVLLLLFVLAAPTLATATTATCSTMPSCKAGSKAAGLAADRAVAAALAAFTTNVEQSVAELLDRLTRAANNNSQTAQYLNTAMTNTADVEQTPAIASAVGQVRAEGLKSYSPSISNCIMLTRNRELAAAEFIPARGARLQATQRASTDYAAQAPGSPTERGTLQAASRVFRDINEGFCDPAVLNPPQGVPCTLANDREGNPMDWRYAKPFEAVFRHDVLPENDQDPENRAARLVSRMLIEPVTPDRTDGDALLRQGGANAFILRQADIAAVSLAKGVIDRMVDDRIPVQGAPGGLSLQQQRVKAWQDAMQAFQEAQQRGAQPEGPNIGDLATLVRDQNQIYFQIYRNLERLAALKAASLARTIKQQRAGGSVVSARVQQQ